MEAEEESDEEREDDDDEEEEEGEGEEEEEESGDETRPLVGLVGEEGSRGRMSGEQGAEALGMGERRGDT